MPPWSRPKRWRRWLSHPQPTGWGRRPGPGPGAPAVRYRFWRHLAPAYAGLLEGGSNAALCPNGPLAHLRRPPLPQVESYQRSPFFAPSALSTIDLDQSQALAQGYGVVSFLRTHRPPKEDETTEAITAAQEHMEHRTPQYFLRNIGRYEKDTEDELQFVVHESPRVHIDEPAIREIADTLRRRFRLSTDEPLATETLVDYAIKTRRLLYRETWTRFFGHDVSTHITGPGWKFFPDDEAFARYGKENSERLELEVSHK